MANEFARRLRKEMTDAERFVWAKLKYRQLGGFKFRRQAEVGVYVVDFLCNEAKVVFELDGSQHADRVAKDEEPTRWLESQGFRVFRVWNHQVFEEWDSVSDHLWRLLCESKA